MKPSLRPVTVFSLAKTLIALAAGVALAFSWLIHDSLIAAALGWATAFLFSFMLIHRHSWQGFMIAGVVGIGGAFYWLFDTIQLFGGFPKVVAIPIYAFFVVCSATPFVFAKFFFHLLPQSLDRFSLRAPIVFTAVELLPYLIFPWKFGHTQLGWLTFAQTASLGGASLITFIMFWVASAMTPGRKNFSPLGFVVSIPIFIGLLIFGSFELSNQKKESTPPLSISVIQANVSTEQKRDVKSFTDNLERYQQLTQSELGQNRLIIWPESVFQEWIHAGVREQRQDPRLTSLPHGERFLFGALTFETETRYFNSALMILPDGSITTPYHKRILMPFGEFMPMAEAFPWLITLNPHVASFTAGNRTGVFTIPAGGTSSSIKLSPLICYEDIVPSMSHDAVMQGAQLLVNLTNDAWFGDTMAPWQHHRIAAFRSIENRRYLIRSTNSGVTAVVAPWGETIGTLPPFSDGILKAEVYPRESLSWYSRGVGEGIGLFCLYFSIVCSVFSGVRAWLKKSR